MDIEERRRINAERERKRRAEHGDEISKARAANRLRRRDEINERRRLDRLARPEYYREMEARRYQTRKEKVLVAARIYHDRGDVQRRNRYRHVQKLYGLSRDQIDRLMVESYGKCEICLDRFEGKFEPSIDHCHVTGRVRGLLCDACNLSLGKLKENPETFRRAADYLDRHKP